MNNKFTNKKVVLPVIHVETEEQAMQNVKIAQDCGADGVFIISHGYFSGTQLFELALKLKRAFNGFWIGVNCLDMPPLDVISTMPLEIDGVWSDNARIDERIEEHPYSQQIVDMIQKRGWQGLYFGGVAFKYQRQVENLESAVEKAKPFMNVICTSGVGTGHAADLTKMARMKKAAGEFPLAIASGITPVNVTEYLPYIDYFLVATGINKVGEEMLDTHKTRDLANSIHNYGIAKKF